MLRSAALPASQPSWACNTLLRLRAGRERLFEQARFPADKRPVKVHNLQLALGELLRAGLSLDVRVDTLRSGLLCLPRALPQPCPKCDA